MKLPNVKKWFNQVVLTDGRDKKTKILEVMIIVTAACTGFAVRAAFVLKGYSAFNSDETFHYHVIQSFWQKSEIKDYVYQWSIPAGPHFLLYSVISFLIGNNLSVLPFVACMLNVFLYLLWMYVFVRRTGNFWSSIPFLVFLVFPSPSVSYLGTCFSAIRMSCFYGAFLVLFAGKWFTRPWRCIGFGLLVSWGCLGDPFTVFFVLPVLWYEKNFLLSRNWPTLSRIAGLTALGAISIYWFQPGQSLWIFFLKTGYLKPGLGSIDMWLKHGGMLLKEWPVYWLGGVPWGYLENSSLGRFLNPFLGSAVWSVTPFLFWPLLVISAFGCVFFIFKKKVDEILLWLVPAVLFVLFFVFGEQSWDALTFRYLGFWQLMPAIFLSLWVHMFRRNWGIKIWGIVLVSWILLHASFLSIGLRGTSAEHPGKRIADRLEQEGYRAGFANYWVSEPVRYFSNDHILLRPYDAPPNSRRATWAVQNSDRIALVWVMGLDRPESLNELIRQIKTLDYRQISTVAFPQEGWSIIGWERKRPPRSLRKS